MHFLSALSNDFAQQIEKAKEILRPYTKRAYLVGGSVRDLALNTPLHDVDIEVYDIDPHAFDVLMTRVGAVGVGKSFFVYKLGNIDFSLPRIERKTGVGHAGFDVTLCQDEKIASMRRDFSMNAMMLNIFTEDLLDFWDGKQSIADKQITLINETHFKEDSLRVLRAVQFSARLGFKIESKSLEIMQGIALDDLSKPRILWEFEKLFNAQHLHYGLFYMYKLCLFEKCFDANVPQLFLSTARILRRATGHFEEALRAYYFFYIVANHLGENPMKWLKRLDAPNHYLNTFKFQPYFEGECEDEKLLHVSLDLPIKQWLGHALFEVKERAQELGIWDTLFSGGVSVQDVMHDGFKHKEIGIELRRRKMEKIAQWK